MLNKPKGVVSASEGKGERTVCDLVPENLCAVGCSRPADSIKILRALC